MSKVIKVPKKTAGVKIPRPLRKGPLGQFLDSSAGQLLIAEAMLAVVALLAVRRTGTGQRLGATLAARALHPGADNPQRASERLAAAFRAALDAFRDALQDSEPLAAANSEEELSSTRLGDEDPAAKKRSASSAKGSASAH